MGKPTGFLEIERHDRGYDPPAERLKHYREFVRPLPVADVRQQSTMNYLVRDNDVILNLAGQVSHIDSMQDPYTDLEINCRS